MEPLSIPGTWMHIELYQKDSEQGNVEILPANFSTSNPTRIALKFNPLLLSEKAVTNGSKYNKAVVKPAVERIHKDSKIMIR